MRYPIHIKEANFSQLLEIIDEESNNYIKEVKICRHFASSPDIETLLSDDALDQFKAIIYSLKFPLKDVDYDISVLFGYENPTEEQSRLIQSWILLGSAVEVVLQMFLAVYIFDYENSGFKKWVDYNEQVVKERIVSEINAVVEDGLMKAEQARSLKSKIKDELKSRRNLPSINKIMLTELIHYYKKYVEFQDEYIEKLNVIRDNRNGIHAFTPRNIGDWNTLIDILRFYCVLLLDLRTMIPDYSDAIEAENYVRQEIESYYQDFTEYEQEIEAEFDEYYNYLMK